MTTTSIMTDENIKTMLYRLATTNGSLSATQYLPASQFRTGIDQVTPTVSSTALTRAVPITDGTVNDDGDNQMTGSDGGDNTTDNAATYKEGAGATDAKAQNLITTGSNVTKTWTIADLSANGTNIDGTEPFACWIYIKDAAALAKFKTSSTALEIRLGSSAANYYSKTVEASELSLLWNWITTDEVNVEDLTETGTVAGNIDTFIIQITTNNAADAFVAGDVVYDLLRQWATTDLVRDFQAGFPSVNFSKFEITYRGFLGTLSANGFALNGFANFNKDTAELLLGIDSFDDESKSSTDEITFIAKDRIRT